MDAIKRDQVRRLLENGTDMDVISVVLGLNIDDVRIQQNLMKREHQNLIRRRESNRHYQRGVYQANIKSLKWAPRRPEKGNRAVVTAQEAMKPKFIQSLTEALCGDPMPHNILARETRG